MSRLRRSPTSVARRALPRRVVAAAVAALLIGAVPPPLRAAEMAAGDKKDPGRAITSQLICPCSCGEVLSGCTCETGISLKGYVDRELKAGKDKTVIEAALVAKYGEVILGAPKAKGFNLLVWVAPFVFTLIGFGFASLILVRWVRRKREPVPAAGAVSPNVDTSLDELRARAEAELREMKE
ncbi:MAG TPA: cytochrome c-type biogenesis protein CcmH [Acidobacteriota bacterium]|nr:cytochrome c-type biogenesis protein CcmH [Acidobacteriota bacterium]